MLNHTSNRKMKTCLEPLWDTEPFCTNEGVCTWICITLWHIKENAQADVPLWFSKLWTAKLLCRPIIICGFLSIILQFYPSNEQREEEGVCSACCITFTVCVLCERWGSVYRGGAGWRWGFSTSSWWDKLDVLCTYHMVLPFLVSIILSAQDYTYLHRTGTSTHRHVRCFRLSPPSDAPVRVHTRNYFFKDNY